jgi:hypothetical protein
MKTAKEESEIISNLDRVDWNFPGTSTLLNTVHSLHRFPGNYIPQVPSYLIQILSEPGDLVLDPFCGSGTTGVEALMLGRRTYQSDVNLASIEVAKGKMAMFRSQNIKEGLKKVLSDLASYPLTKPIIISDITKIDPELESWFHNDTLIQLKTIWQIISNIEDPEIHNVLIMLFTDTLFACASTGKALTSGGKARRHHWGWVADNVKPKPPLWHNAFKVFRDRLIHAYDVASALETTITRLPDLDLKSLQVIRQDIRQLNLPDSCVDLVVTSPPYLGMIDYTLANRLTYLWFGWSLLEDKELEIGARYRRSRKNVVEEYLASMEISCKNISRVLRSGAYCAIVIGSSRKFPEVTNQTLQIFGYYLELIWGPIKRNPSRRRVSERKGTEFYEYICVFKK